MKHLIGDYIDYHKSAWAETTLKKEAARLRAVAPELSKSPEELFTFCQEKGLKPYTIKTLFVRLAHFETWALEKGKLRVPKGYKEFKARHARVFKAAYKREELSVSFEEARERLAKIECAESRRLGMALLGTGLRIHELWSVEGDKVTGKGGRVRHVFQPIERPRISRSKLEKDLKAVGLKAHTLRKLFATRVAQSGVRPEDLCEIMGWTNIETAYFYLQPAARSALAAKVAAAVGTL